MALADVDTVVYVDVDGVLNVGIQRSGKPALILNTSNIEISYSDREHRTLSDLEAMDRMLAVVKADIGQGEQGTYARFACGTSSVSAVLAKRLADIIQKAGGKSRIILASNWRRPKQAGHVKNLEAQISKHLGRKFCFDGATPQGKDIVAADRLRCIGSHLSCLCESRSGRPLRVLIIDDFFITPLDGWACDGAPVSKVADAEAYLRSLAPDADLAVKLVHTYSHWETHNGLDLQMGCGLTMAHFRQAVDFLEGEAKPSIVLSPKRMSSPCSQVVHKSNGALHDVLLGMATQTLRFVPCLS